MEPIKPKTLQQIIQHFSDEQVCIDAVARMRWPNGAECPACAAKEPYYLKTQKRWKCRDCRRQFSVKLGTIFEDSPIPLQKWLPALWMLVNCRNGISSYEISRALGVSQKSAWFMLHRLRLVLQNGNVGKFGGPGSEIESDETFVGGKAKNMHASRRAQFKAAREASMNDASYVNKTIVWGVLDREQRKVRATVVAKVNREALQTAVLDQVASGSKVYTDEARVYSSLPKDEYIHEFVNHLEKYVDGRVSTNGIENFWSLLKRGLNGTYVAVEPFHLFRYVDEQAFRYNHRKDETGRKLSDAERFEIALSRVAGKRLTFAEVIGKDGSDSETTTPAPEPF